MQAGNFGRSTTNPSQILAPIVATPEATRSADAVGIETPRPEDLSQLRILHLVNGEHFSGAERVQSHLGRCLPKFLVQADFACVKPGKFFEMLAANGGTWGRGYNAEMSNRFDLRAVWKVRRLLRLYDYDLLHAHTPRTAMLASIVSRLTGVPWIYHVHSPVSRDSSRVMINRINSLTERLSLIGCAHLITVSESLRLDCIRRGAPETAVSVVHNGVPTIRPQRTSTPVLGGRWVIGMVALMRPRKGLEIVLDAIAKLRNQHDLILRIIGPFETGEYEAAIDAQIARLQISELVERVGFTTDIPAELARLDAMVLPSLYGEGLPMVVLEAMAAGLPVIATRVEGTPEAVTDGVEGLLAEPRDADSLAERIAELVSGVHDWQQMSEAACGRHAKDFSDLAMARNTAAVYRNVLREEPTQS